MHLNSLWRKSICLFIVLFTRDVNKISLSSVYVTDFDFVISLGE